MARISQLAGMTDDVQDGLHLVSGSQEVLAEQEDQRPDGTVEQQA